MTEPAAHTWLGTPRRRVYLLRHGDVDYFDAAGRPYAPDTVPLNAEGRRQAQAAAHALARVPLDHAVTSGLVRGVETASLVTAQRGLTLDRRPAFREIEPGAGLGALARSAPADAERAFVGALPFDLRPEARFLGGEAFGDFADRVGAGFAALLAERDWQQLLLVGHNVVNRLLLCRAVGAGLGALGAFEQDPGCVNVLDVDDAGRCLVRLVNYTPCNPVKAGMELTTLERLYLQFLGQTPPPQPGCGGDGEGL